MLTAQLLGIVLAGVWSDRSGPAARRRHRPGPARGRVGHLRLRHDVPRLPRRPRPHRPRRRPPRRHALRHRRPVLPGGDPAPAVHAASRPPGCSPRCSAPRSRPSSRRTCRGGGSSGASFPRCCSRWPRSPTPGGASTTSSLTASVGSRDHAAHVRAAWAGLGIAVAAGALQLGTARAAARAGRPRRPSARRASSGSCSSRRCSCPAGTWLMRRGLPSVMLARALFSAAFYAGITYVPLFLVGQRGLSLQTAGLSLAVGAIGWAAGAWYQGHDTLHLPRYRLVEVGGVLLAARSARPLRGRVARAAVVARAVRPRAHRRRDGRWASRRRRCSRSS